MKTSTPKKPALPAPSPKSLPLIGNSALIEVAGIQSVPAKIDTGASYSSIWASDIQMLPSGELEFTLFAPKSPLYTGELLRTRRYRAVRVRNSTGQESIRYSVPLSALINGKRIRVRFTLADRHRNDFPVLIGRRTLKNKFLVDVSRLDVPYKSRIRDAKLTRELLNNPQKFHQKYIHKH